MRVYACPDCARSSLPDPIPIFCHRYRVQVGLLARVQPALSSTHARGELGDEEWLELQTMIAVTLRTISTGRLLTAS